MTQSRSTPESLEAPHKKRRASCPKCGKQFRGHSIGTHAQKCNLTLAEMFWVKVDKAGAGGCWLWTASQKEKGYGQFLHKGKMHRAHRLAWSLSGHELPARPLELAHTCDNRLCVNPAHLFVATHQQNMTDCMVKRRHTFGAKNCTAKLNDALVLQLRAEGLRTTEAITKRAAELGIGVSTLTHALSGRTWKHL